MLKKYYHIYPKYWDTLNYVITHCNILAITFEQVSFTNSMSKIAVCVANSVSPPQMLHSAVSDLTLYCLLRPIFPNT